MKKNLTNSKKNEYRHIKATIGELITEFDIFGQLKETISLNKESTFYGG